MRVCVCACLTESSNCPNGAYIEDLETEQDKRRDISNKMYRLVLASDRCQGSDAETAIKAFILRKMSDAYYLDECEFKGGPLPSDFTVETDNQIIAYYKRNATDSEQTAGGGCTCVVL